MLAIVGGHSFQDYRDYRERVLGSLEHNGLVLGEDVVLLGTVSDAELPEWFAAADGFAFPSMKEAGASSCSRPWRPVSRSSRPTSRSSTSS